MQTSTAQQPVVATATGKVRGTTRDGIHRFKGIPYGADTAGANRFLPPQAIAWTGVREAVHYGPRSPQLDRPQSAPYLAWLSDATPTGEDCLVLNVFTGSLSEIERRPVMVYLHGGGFTIGSPGAPGTDGSNLARRGAVVVTLNHRLNLFGHLHLGDADGGRYADAGNLGLLDCVAALEWVKVNIARFGGDPAQVTILGQSGGASKVALLMAMPAARGLFHRAIIQSASSLLKVATLEQAERNTDGLLRQLNLDKNRLGTLRELPAQTLLQAMTQAVTANDGVDNYRPVVDGRALPWQPFSEEAIQGSAHIPLMMGWCENEQRYTFAATPQVYGISTDQAIAATARVLHISTDAACAILKTYQRHRPQESPGDLYAQIVGDYRYRRNITLAAERRVAQGGADVFMYMLNYKSPAMDGLLRTPHTLCIAFAFANVDHAIGIAGAQDDRYPLQEQMAEAWLAFARSGHPHHAGLPAWPAYSPAQRPTMVFDRTSVLWHDPLAQERAALACCPPYDASLRVDA